MPYTKKHSSSLSVNYIDNNSCGGPKKAGAASRATNFLLSAKRNHRFSGTPFADDKNSPAYACNLVKYIYVSAGSSNSAQYKFYTDSEGNKELVNNVLDLKREYQFQRLNEETANPFYISDMGKGKDASDKIELTGDGSATEGITGDESFTLTFNGLTTDDTLTYYCTSNSNMTGTFTLV